MAFQRPPAANLVTPPVDPNPLRGTASPFTVVGTFTAVSRSDLLRLDTGRDCGHTFKIYGATTAGAGSATVVVYGQNDPNEAPTLLGTITITLSTTPGSDTANGFWTLACWPHVYFDCTALTGTGAYVTATVGG